MWVGSVSLLVQTLCLKTKAAPLSSLTSPPSSLLPVASALSIPLDHTGPRGRLTPKLSSVDSQQNTRLTAGPGEDIRNNIKYLSEMLGGFLHYHSKVQGTLKESFLFISQTTNF